MNIGIKKGFIRDMNHKGCPQMVKDKEISKNSASKIQWPFSSSVFLPFPYNNSNNKNNMPLNGSVQKNVNDQIYSVASPSFWHTSSGPALDHNVKPPLTILYSGSRHVYHGVSSATVEAIKSIAASPMTVETKQNSLAKNSKPQPSNASAEMITAKFIAGGSKSFAIAMARKATLARFLQKRKYRLTSAKPYEVRSEKKLYRPTPQSPTTSFFNSIPMLLQEEGAGSSSSFT